MHYLHLIAVEADDRQDAVDEVESFLSAYAGEVYDWYEIGGRWSGALAGDDVLCARDDAPAFLEAVEGMVESRRGTLRELRRHLSGPDGGHEPGLGGFAADDGARERLDQHYAASAALFAELLHTDEIDDERFGLLGYRLYKLGRLVAGHYDSESGFYDAATGDAGPGPLRLRVLEDPGRQWLVAVDLHN